MKVNIADLFDDMAPMLELEENTVVSSEKIKALTKHEIHKNNKHSRKWGRVLLVAAVLCTLLCVTASASGWNPFRFLQTDPGLKEPTLQTNRTLAAFMVDASTAKKSTVEKYRDMGEEVYSCSFRKHLHSLIFYSGGEIKALDTRDETAVYRPEMTEKEAATYARKAEAACPRVLDALHDDGYIKGCGSEIDKCFCNDFAGSQTIFNGDSVWVNVLMRDDSAYCVFLEPDTFVCKGFVYTKSENMPVMYNGLFAAMRDGTEAQWWYDLQHADGLG